jgi:hypothetical protein
LEHLDGYSRCIFNVEAASSSTRATQFTLFPQHPFFPSVALDRCLYGLNLGWKNEKILKSENFRGDGLKEFGFLICSPLTPLEKGGADLLEKE